MTEKINVIVVDYKDYKTEYNCRNCPIRKKCK